MNVLRSISRIPVRATYARGGLNFIRMQSSVAAEVPEIRTTKLRSEINLPPSITEKYKLYEPTRFIPIIFGGLIGLNQLGYYHFDAESQLLVVFTIYVGLVYTQFGESIGKYLDDYAADQLNSMREQEEEIYAGLQSSIDQSKEDLKVHEDVLAMSQLQEEVVRETEAARTAKFEVARKKWFQQKLELLMNVEMDEAEKLRGEVISSITEKVTKEMEASKGGLGTALDILEQKKTSSEEVGDMYKKFLQEYNAEIKKNGVKMKATDAQVASIKAELEKLKF